MSSRQSQSVCPARLRADASGAADQKVYRFLAAAKLAAMIVLALEAQTAHNLDPADERDCARCGWARESLSEAGRRFDAAPSTLII